MSKQVSASDAKNNFGGLLDDVAALGRVDIMKHGRLVAVVLSPRVLSAALGEAGQPARVMRGGGKHMIPPERGRSEEHTSELQSPCNFLCRLFLGKKKEYISHRHTVQYL